MSSALYDSVFSMFTRREMALAPCSQHPYLKATWLTVVQRGRTVIPVLAGSSHKEGKVLGGCHLHNGKSVQEGHQYCRRSFLLSLWWIRVTGTVFTTKMMTPPEQELGVKKKKKKVVFFSFCKQLIHSAFLLFYFHFFRLSFCECGPAGNNDTLLII